MTTNTGKQTNRQGKELDNSGHPAIIRLPATITVSALADAIGVSPIEVIKQLMRRGIMAALNQVVDFQTAATISADFGRNAEPEATHLTASKNIEEAGESEESVLLEQRPPVVTILGHVDHGKTTLLDTIRMTKVAEKEVGGITQHIGAYQVGPSDQKITFLDTPGHEAFTALRARGAQITDIAVLVVAADDGIMPQTIEAIEHAKAAKVPIVVAINKMDLPGADADRVKRQLSEHGLLIEEWGGDVIAIPVSAVQGTGINDLLGNIQVVAEVAELRANPNRLGQGVIIETKLDANRGPLATVLVQEGTLNLGDNLAVGSARGRIKTMTNDLGHKVSTAKPSDPVEILGLSTVPIAGDTLQAYKDEKSTRDIVAQRIKIQEKQKRPNRPPGLAEIFSQTSDDSPKELNLVVKSDVQGSGDAIRTSLERLSSDQAKVNLIQVASGGIVVSDIVLAVASKAIVIGFNTRIEPSVKRLAEQEGIEIRTYDIIYRLIDDIQLALQGMLEPTYRDVIEGNAVVRAVFQVRRRNTVAGVYVQDGRMYRGSEARILRAGQEIFDGVIASLRHLHDDVREMGTGTECGILMQDYTDFQEGDIIQCHRKERT